MITRFFFTFNGSFMVTQKLCQGSFVRHLKFLQENGKPCFEQKTCFGFAKSAPLSKTLLSLPDSKWARTILMEPWGPPEEGSHTGGWLCCALPNRKIRVHTPVRSYKLDALHYFALQKVLLELWVKRSFTWVLSSSHRLTFSSSDGSLSC